MIIEILIWGLIIVGLLITLGAQAFISSCNKKYSAIRNISGLTGAQAARIILDRNGLQNVKVGSVSGYLTDHYDPRTKVVNLSESNYSEASIAGVAVACHECGHAIQDKNGYTFLKIRRSLVPVVNLCTYAGYAAIIIGGILGSLGLIWLGIGAEFVILFFQLVTLPVEFNASKRGLQQLRETNLLNSDEIKGGKKMLTSAALTYVASVATTIMQIIRLILIYGRRER